MKETTKYQYQKRIRELEAKVDSLWPYRALAHEIFSAMVANHKTGSRTNEHWIIEKYKAVFK